MVKSNGARGLSKRSYSNSKLLSVHSCRVILKWLKVTLVEAGLIVECRGISFRKKLTLFFSVFRGYNSPLVSIGIQGVSLFAKQFAECGNTTSLRRLESHFKAGDQDPFQRGHERLFLNAIASNFHDRRVPARSKSSYSKGVVKEKFNDTRVWRKASITSIFQIELEEISCAERISTLAEFNKLRRPKRLRKMI